MELPVGPDPTWTPLGTQFLDAAASTALTIPSAIAGSRGQIEFAAILIAQAVRQWIRLDGNAVTAAVTGGIIMEPGDYLILRGRKNIEGVRVIRDAVNGSLAVTYYTYRPTL